MSAVEPIEGVVYRRPWTPPRRLEEGGTRYTVKRMCNRCSRLIGDVTDEEIFGAIYGEPLTDVTDECPFCTPESS
jgi:hypothetical protein